MGNSYTLPSGRWSLDSGARPTPAASAVSGSSADDSPTWRQVGPDGAASRGSRMPLSLHETL